MINMKVLIEDNEQKIYVPKGQKAPKGKKLQTGPRGGQYFTGSAGEKETYKKLTSKKQASKKEYDGWEEKQKQKSIRFKKDNKQSISKIKDVFKKNNIDFNTKQFQSGGNRGDHDFLSFKNKNGVSIKVIASDNLSDVIVPNEYKFVYNDPNETNNYGVRYLKTSDTNFKEKLNAINSMKEPKEETQEFSDEAKIADDKLRNQYDKAENFFKKIARRSKKTDDNQEFFETLGTWMEEKRSEIEGDLGKAIDDSEWNDITQQMTDQIAEDPFIWESRVKLKSLIKEI